MLRVLMGAKRYSPPLLLQYASGKMEVPRFLFNRKYVGNTSIPSNASISPIVIPPKYSTSIVQSPFPWENLPNTLIFPNHPSNHPPCPTRNAVGISAEKSSGTIHATPWARRPQRKLSDQMVRYPPRPGCFTLPCWSPFKGDWDPINTH